MDLARIRSIRELVVQARDLITNAPPCDALHAAVDKLFLAEDALVAAEADALLAAPEGA